MAFEKIKQLIEKAKHLLHQLDQNGESLDELQKAQVVQSLLQAKITIVKELQVVTIESQQKDEHKHLFTEVKALEKRIQEHAQTVDFPKVQAALERLGHGVSELLKRKPEKN